MKQRLLFLLFILTVIRSYAQNEQNVWTFGTYGGVDFNTPVPTIVTVPDYMQGGSAMVCNTAGQLLFSSNGYKIWNRYNQQLPYLVANGPLMTWTGGIAAQSVTIVPFPGDTNLYYVFSLGEQGLLYYTVVDMRLDNGNGDVVPGKKSIQLADDLGSMLTSVQGCNNVWLLVRHKNTHQYRAYEITAAGITPDPVLSDCGSLPASWGNSGLIKCSADGHKMAATQYDPYQSGTIYLQSFPFSVFSVHGGVELYDFDPATGKIANARVLDSSSLYGYYYGVCFSPDGTRLYASTLSSPSPEWMGTPIWYGAYVHQFDLSLGNTAAMAASNTIVFTEPALWQGNLGELKRAPNGKIYFVRGLNTSPPYQGYLHAIDQPDLLGAACLVQPYAIALGSGAVAFRGMPADIIKIPLPDSVGRTINVPVCYRDSVLLIADSGKHYLWQHGGSIRSRMVTAGGRYIVGFTNTSCNYEQDTFNVSFYHQVPVLGPRAYACPGGHDGRLVFHQAASDSNSYTYSWSKLAGPILQTHHSRVGDTLSGLDTGFYKVQVINAAGCDTLLIARVAALPVPDGGFTCDTLVCKGVTILFADTTSTAVSRFWNFGDGGQSVLQKTGKAYYLADDYKVKLVVRNIEGCTDTVSKLIHIKGLDLQAYAVPDIVAIGTEVHLRSKASEPYQVLAWVPQSAGYQNGDYDEWVTVVHTGTYKVIGQSSFGCIDSATVLVQVNPEVFMPSAFSPNGDGKNDRFRPQSAGAPVLVREFNIYNRWGKLIWSANGPVALQGWDGSYGGLSADLGVYFYTINMETPSGGTIQLKGDVALLR